jgi:Protein of unknown function (DUF2817)
LAFGLATLPPLRNGNQKAQAMWIEDAFSETYAQARVKFLEAAATAGLAIESQAHPLTGRHGEVLAMDVARDGAPGADKLLIISSACHGVEGHCGSGLQVSALRDPHWLAHARSAGVAVLYIHALNPHGYSYSRRVTQENVDLNRNFQHFGPPLPQNPAYASLHALLLPVTWPPDADNLAATGGWIAQHGMAAYQAAVTGGQYEFADGLFFGGTAPTWSNQCLRRVLRQHAMGARQLAWLDVHTGLGQSGLCERIWAGPNDAVAIDRARDWWGGGGATPITSFFDGSSSSAPVSGLLNACVQDEAPQASYTGLALEYGTQPVFEVLQALRADHWLHRQRLRGLPVAERLAESIGQQMRDAFYTATPEWQGQVISQGRQALFQAVDGLTRGATT